MIPVQALLDESSRNKKLQGPIYLGVSLKKDAVDERQSHPVLVPLRHRTRRKDEEMVCLVVKDPQHATISKLEADPATKNLFDEVIGVGKLRKRLGSKKAVQEFANSFTTIFVQEKVAKPLTEALGLSFLKHAKHLPIVITLGEPFDGRLVRYQVKRALKSAQLVLKPSPFVSVRVGHTKMSEKDITENIEAAAKAAKKQFGATKMHIKTPESMSLELS